MKMGPVELTLGLVQPKDTRSIHIRICLLSLAVMIITLTSLMLLKH